MRVETQRHNMNVSTESRVARAPARSPGRPPAFELKGVMTSLAVMRPHTVDLALIQYQLHEKIANLPQFFQDAPVVLDLGAMPRGGLELPPGAPTAAANRPSMVVRHPVRSGQVIYAERADLVVLGPVNPGGEVLADGHIHLYGTLRGRAIAGAQGYAGAQIFCQKLEAELVAVGGAYVLSDDIPADRRGRPSQILLADGECRIGPL